MTSVLNIAPTRMELIRLRRRVALAQKGHDLLREKMDALIMEFFEILKKIQESRAKSVGQLMTAHRTLSKCMAKLGTIETLEAMRESKRDAQLEISTRFIMGVVVPVVENKVGRNVLERGYSIHTTVSDLDQAAKDFELALKSLSEVAELEAAAHAIARELEKTKRRVNALEYIILPQIRATLKFIVMRLDEIERENFTRLKRIKAILEKQNESR